LSVNLHTPDRPRPSAVPFSPLGQRIVNGGEGIDRF